MNTSPHPSRNLLISLSAFLYLFAASCGGGGKEETLPAGEPPASTGDTAQVWVAPDAAGMVTNPHPSTPASIEKGKTIFLQHCVSCHGTDGKAQVPAGLAVKAANLMEKTPGQADGALHWKLLTGRNGMLKISVYGISDDDGWHIINYIRTLTEA